MTCVVCNKKISNSEAYFQLDCKNHLVHSRHGVIDCKLPECIGHKLPQTATAAKMQQQPLLEASDRDVEIQRKRQISMLRAKEPLCPPEAAGIFTRIAGSVMRSASRIGDLSKPDTESSDPLVLLRARVPLIDIRDKHGMDITELINDHGVNINHFLENGYRLPEMCDVFSSRLNAHEGMKVLEFLGVSDEHFRRCPDLVDPTLLQERLGYRPEDLKTHFGYQFHPNSPWTIPEMIRAKMTMATVMNAGMTRAEDWARLKSTATLPAQLTAFGVTRQLESQLTVDLPPQQSIQPQQAPAVLVNQSYHAQGASVSNTRQPPAAQQQQQDIPPVSQRIIVPGVEVSRSEYNAIIRARGEPSSTSFANYSGPKLVDRSSQAPFKLLVVPSNYDK